jgi:hypothetical protein
VVLAVAYRPESHHLWQVYRKTASIPRPQESIVAPHLGVSRQRAARDQEAPLPLADEQLVICWT